MRCVECKHFYRLDLRKSPPAVICAKKHDSDTDHNKGCGCGEYKSKNAPVWGHGDGPGKWYSQARRTCAFSRSSKSQKVSGGTTIWSVTSFALRVD